MKNYDREQKKCVTEPQRDMADHEHIIEDGMNCTICVDRVVEAAKKKKEFLGAEVDADYKDLLTK